MRTATTARAAHDVVRCRRAQLTRSRLPLPLAARLTKDARYDLHALNTTRGALHETLHDARRKLRLHLDERGPTLDTWLEGK